MSHKYLHSHRRFNAAVAFIALILYLFIFSFHIICWNSCSCILNLLHKYKCSVWESSPVLHLLPTKRWDSFCYGCRIEVQVSQTGQSIWLDLIESDDLWKLELFSLLLYIPDFKLRFGLARCVLSSPPLSLIEIHRCNRLRVPSMQRDMTQYKNRAAMCGFSPGLVFHLYPVT